MNPFKLAQRRYVVEIIGAAALVWALGYARTALHPSDPALKTALALSPLIPILFIFLSVWRFVQSMDEYGRSILIKSWAAGAALVVFVAMTYPVLQQGLGLPPLSFIYSLLAMLAGAVLYGSLYKWRDGVGLHGKSAMVKGFIYTAMAAIIPATLYILFSERLGWPHTWRNNVVVAIVAFAIYRAYRVFSDKSS